LPPTSTPSWTTTLLRANSTPLGRQATTHWRSPKPLISEGQAFAADGEEVVFMRKPVVTISNLSGGQRR
jgi:hypothetical protein